ncbi:hypothetical protein [Hymenobacter rubripertinctus]|uniref:Uncharacterized protein n=1 Tax=Hymenobacter rubripertinctus TaxID=2029981 RepID=A0A418R2X3_9BACT|nr:hypothetical protein [Hymenobacter rubripertinctus]RIY11782.1 hypothetical protein D0T11_06380 [Hymenobacter rubripertinctus]
MKTPRKKAALPTPRQKPYLTPPAHLPGSPARYEKRHGFTRRLHNRRVSVITTPSGGYQIHLATVLLPGQADELRRQGYHNTIGDYILRDRVRYSVVTLSAEAFEAAVWGWEQHRGRQQRKRA